MAGLATAPPLGSVAAPPPMCRLWWHWGSAQPQRWPSIRGTCGRRVTPSLETSPGEEKEQGSLPALTLVVAAVVSAT